MSTKADKETIDQICRLYQEGYTSREIGKSFGIGKSTVLCYLEQRSIPRRQGKRRILTPMDEVEVVRQYAEGKTSTLLGKTFHVSQKTILNILHRKAVRLRKGGQKYIVGDETFFETINSERKAYWLGFLFGDGNVHKNCLTLGLQGRDSEHLLTFLSDLGGNYPIHHYLKKLNGKEFPFSQLQIYSDKLTADLIQQGMIPRKTWRLKWPPKLSSQLYAHFIRGFNDADGGFYITNDGKSPRFQITSIEKFLVEMQRVLMENCKLKRTKLVKSYNSKVLCYGGRRQVSRIFSYLYSEATVWLPRKRDKIEPHL